MAKKRNIPDRKGDTRARVARCDAYAEKVRRMFAATVNEIMSLNLTPPNIADGVMYSFDGDSKNIRKEIEQLFRRLHSSTVLAIEKGIYIEWEEANKACDKIIKSKFLEKVLESGAMQGWNARNDAARRAFSQRTQNGFNLSSRIWNDVRQFREEMEVAITISIGEGVDAGTISRRVRQYLNDPDLMFKRFRYKIGEEDILDAGGNVIGKKSVFGKKWKKRIKDPETGKYKFIDYDRDSYKVGRGMYKSAAKNAMRVARTETNMAYRRADHERWKRLDFVLGVRIKLSKSHPMVDICDKLAGDYPKDFLFDGWHPQCFCIATPILVDEDEITKMNEAILNGEEYTPEADYITEYPQGFKDFVRDNKENIIASQKNGSAPYFVQNNAGIIDGIIREDTASNDMNTTLNSLSPQEIAASRHAARMPEQVADEQWQLSRMSAALDEIDIDWDESLNELAQGRAVGGTKKQQLGNYLRALKTLSGDDSLLLSDGKIRGINISLHDAADYLTQGLYGNSDIKQLLAVAKNKMYSYASRIPRIKDIVELKNTDVSKIPSAWRADFIDAVNQIKGSANTAKALIRSTDQGIALQYAGNIARLSVNPKALAMGLSNLSPKTPVEFFTTFEAAIPGYSNCLKGWSKDFFNSLKTFVPLRTDINDGCHYSLSGRYVCINPNHKDTRERLKSDFFKRSILSHEFGHAMFYQYDWDKDPDIRGIYDKWVRVLNMDKGATVKKLINDELNKIIKAGHDNYGYDEYEQLGKISDSVQAAIKGHSSIAPMGHPTSYFKTYEAQLNEIIAHCSENTWVGNPIFEKIAPGLYRKMRELIKLKLGIII